MNTLSTNKRFRSKYIVIFLILVLYSISTEAQTLKSIADSKGVYIGNIMSSGFLNNNNIDGGEPNNILRNEFNVTVLENDMKMSNILPNRPSNPFNFGIEALKKDRIDKFIKYCKQDDPNNQLRTRGHTMIWHSQAPGWLNNEGPTWSKQQVYDFTYSFIKAYATYCGTDIDEWDVFNELLINKGTEAEPFRSNTWFRKAGSTRQEMDDYVKFCFATAREFAPHAKLFYNDFSIERYSNNSNSKNGRMRAFAARMKANNAEIDGIGFQSHLNISFMASGNNANMGSINSIKQSMEELGDLGLEVAITELDIRRCNGSNYGTDAGHKAAHKQFVKMALSQPNCNTFLIWGISDKDSWIPSNQDPKCTDVLLYDDNFNKKSAYFGVREALEEIAGGVVSIGPDGYNYAVDEFETIEISEIPYDVAYGQDGQYEYLLEQRENVSCNNEAFGNDPASGVAKYCFIRESKVPYTGAAIQIPGIIEAENYDFGGEGRSYMDADAGNNGEGFREESGVDIGPGPGGVGYAVGWTSTGEWLEYTVNVSETAMYTFDFSVASPDGTGVLGITVDGQGLLTGLETPQTADWNSYTSLTTNAQLSAGTHVIRINVEEEGFNVDKIDIRNNSLSINTPTREVISIYPNPSKSGIFNLPSKMDFKVYAINGKLLLKAYSDQADLSKFSKGIYLLRTENSIVKIVK